MILCGVLYIAAAGQFLLVFTMQKPSPSALSPSSTAYSWNNFYLDRRQISRVYYHELGQFLANYLQNNASAEQGATRPNSRSAARSKLARLTVPQFHELSTDVYDELVRRKNENEGISIHFVLVVERLSS